MARQIYQHECHIVDLIFSEGPIEGINAAELKSFVMSRINSVLVNMGYGPLEVVEDNPIAEWFYDGINSFSFNDTFSGVGNSYHRNWSETDFMWKPKAQREALPQ